VSARAEFFQNPTTKVLQTQKLKRDQGLANSEASAVKHTRQVKPQASFCASCMPCRSCEAAKEGRLGELRVPGLSTEPAHAGGRTPDFFKIERPNH
jgi:hypothetical protein